MTKKWEFVFVVGLILIVFAAYWHTLDYELIWDSKDLLKRNALLAENASPISAFKVGFLYAVSGMPGQDFYYRPLTTISYMIEKKSGD